ncbi:MAG TPA: OmpA family protein [Kofleriaceae bacterium]|nr:OmpA family protein [Kofleriaceae bacterium]
MVRLVISAAAALALFWVSPRSAEPCGVKLTVKAPKVQKTRTPIAGSQGRTPIKTGPENPDERDPKRVGGDGTGDRGAAVGAGGSETAQAEPQPEPAPPPEEPEEQPEEPASNPADLGRDTGDQGDADTADEPVRRERPARFSDRVFFANASARLSGNTRSKLRASARWLNQNPDKTVTIEGHANTVGDPVANQALSEMRAQAVKDFLVEQGVDESRITVQAYGSERPEYEPGTSGRNRRVILIVN